MGLLALYGSFIESSWSSCSLLLRPSPLDTRLSTVITNGHWDWPPIRSQALADIIRLAPPISGGPDTAKWIPSKTSIFSISYAYNAIRSQTSKKEWAPVVWFKGVIPRHSFISWLCFFEQIAHKAEDC